MLLQRGLPCAASQRSPARRCVRQSRRAAQPARAFHEQTFEDLKVAAVDAQRHAQELLPRLQQLQREALEAELPAAQAERAWQEVHRAQQAAAAEAQGVVGALREAVTAAAGGEVAATSALAQHHAADRLEHFRLAQCPAALQWQAFPAQELPLHSIPGGKLVAKLAACEAEDGSKFGVLALALAGPFLKANIDSVLLHWGCSEGLHAGWMAPPPGFHTLPSVSNPSDDRRAWQTPMACCTPVASGGPVGAGAAAVHSVVVQVPLEGALEVRGGVKFVIHRTDNTPPEWVKAGPHNHGDFFVDFQPAIGLFESQRAAAQAAVLAAAAAADAAAAAAAAARRAELAAAAAEMDAWEGARALRPALAHDRDQALGHSSGSALEEWAWASELLAPEEQEEVVEAATEADTAAAAAGAAAAAAAEEARAAEAAREAALAAAADLHDPELPSWLARVERWEQLPDYPPTAAPSLSQQLGALQRLAAAVDPGGPLPARCAAAEGAVSRQDTAELAAKHAQQEKEHLQGLHRSAAEQAAHLQHEVTVAVGSARRAVVGLRGRQVEVTQRDLEVLSSQRAEELVKRLAAAAAAAQGGGGGLISSLFSAKPKPEERHLVFVQQKVMRVAGMDANLLVQVYVEGPKPPAGTTNAAAASEAAVAAAAEVSSTDAGDGAATAAAAAAAEAVAAAARRPTFDGVVVSVAVAEEYPNGSLKQPLVLHFGAVAHMGAGWQPPPGDWASTAGEAQAHKSAAQVAFDRFTITHQDGSPAFVDPSLHALALRLPLVACQERGARGLEFVLKSGADQWLYWQHGQGSSNFYTELPLPLP